MDISDIVLLSAAVWYISYCLTALDGPFDSLVKLRSLKMGGLFDCIYCTSIWVGFGAILFWLYGYAALLYPFGLAGVGLYLRSYTGAGLHD
jgi:hypothetical protein